MRVGAENRKKLYTAGVLGFFALGSVYFLYSELFGGPSAPPPTPAPVVATAPVRPVVTAAVTAGSKGATEAPGFVVGHAAEKLPNGSNALDPTLHEEAMLQTEAVLYTGTGRNIFSGGPAPAPVLKPVVKPIAPARTQPTPPPVIAQTGPPPPPPIDLKFFGTATSANGTRRAFLLRGDDVFLAAAGDVVQRRYRVVQIAANTITIEDIPNSNKQTLPLLVSP